MPAGATSSPKSPANWLLSPRTSICSRRVRSAATGSAPGRSCAATGAAAPTRQATRRRARAIVLLSLRRTERRSLQYYLRERGQAPRDEHREVVEQSPLLGVDLHGREQGPAQLTRRSPPSRVGGALHSGLVERLSLPVLGLGHAVAVHDDHVAGVEHRLPLFVGRLREH